MKRYYISPVVGTGTIGDAYRAAISDTVRAQNGAGLSTVILSNSDGTPALPWALCIAAAPNHVSIGNVSGVEAMPDITLDSTLAVLPSNLRNRALNFLTGKGVDLSGITTSSTFGELIDRVGKHLDVNFDRRNFDALGNLI